MGLEKYGGVMMSNLTERWRRWRESEVWETADGNEIIIKDITDRHLGNIIRMLTKQIDQMEDDLGYYPSFQGEMAQICAEGAWIEACSHQEYLMKFLNGLKYEQNMRGEMYENRD